MTTITKEQADEALQAVAAGMYQGYWDTVVNYVHQLERNRHAGEVDGWVMVDSDGIIDPATFNTAKRNCEEGAKYLSQWGYEKKVVPVKLLRLEEGE